MRAIIGRIKYDLLSMLLRSMISAPRFIEGGAPILAQAPRKMRIEREGVIDINPLVSASLRVLVFSYIELASANRAEEANPWATIIRRAPVSLQWENINSLHKRSPICLTEA